MSKNKPFDMGDYTPSVEEFRAYVWCIKNNILISPLAIREARWAIEISNKGIINTDPTDYKKIDIWIKIYEYYKYYYNKYENKI
tara:strand:- start:226 stop:477 length:252 start_codon:yes stop_codon:yes gene_type:complete